MADTKLNQKFRQSDSYTKDQLVRDLIELVDQLNKELADIKARLTAGGL